jgi:hypothetical protein
MAGLCHERQNCPTPGFFEFIGLYGFCGISGRFSQRNDVRKFVGQSLTTDLETAIIGPRRTDEGALLRQVGLAFVAILPDVWREILHLPLILSLGRFDQFDEMVRRFRFSH